MADREKVLKGLDELSGFLFKEYGKAQAEEANIYYDRFLTVDNAITMLKDCDTQIQYRDDHIAMYQAEINRLEALLKEHEAVKPKSKSRHGSTTLYQHFCGNCMGMLHGKPNYCPNCGRSVKWE